LQYFSNSSTDSPEPHFQSLYVYNNQGSAAIPSNSVASTTHTIKPAMPSTPVASNPPPQPAAAAVAPSQQVPPQPTGYGVTDVSNDDGPAYDGQTGFGLARGTRNTYVIPGMDEMSPEEYREKLQASISARQAKRREEAMKSGIIGNRSSNGYLDTLGQQGENDDEFDNEVLPEKNDQWRSDSVRSWMEALGKVEKEIESNLDIGDDDNYVLEQAEVVNRIAARTSDAAQQSQSLSELASGNAAQQSQSLSELALSNFDSRLQPKSTSESKHSVNSQPESVIEFASSLKQGRAEKELSRKSEWLTQATIAEMNSPLITETAKNVSKSATLIEEHRWFIEKRQRPVPTSDRPNYATVDKYVGDATKKSVSEQRLDRGWYNEKRVRPIPNSDPGQRPKVTDRTGAQSERKASKSTDSQPTTPGWYNEKRVRPVPNSDVAERPKVTDRTGAQQDRKSTTSNTDTQPTSDGVWYVENRVRPIPNSDPEQRPTVSDRSGAQQNRQSSKVPDILPAVNDGDFTWYNEQRVRPAPNSEAAERHKVADRTGAELEVNKKAVRSTKAESQPKAESDWYNEKRVRPIPNTDSPEHPTVFDRTGDELDATPKGPLRNSLLRSLLNDEPPNRTKIAMQTSDKTAASSEISQWWKDNINRPKDYTSSSNASLNNTYDKRPDPPKNYGDMKLD
jgi:hypothetical protein